MDTDNIINAPGCDATLATLHDLECIIKRGKAIFLEVANALHEIHSRKLYRETHATFEAYVTERWGFSRQHAYRLLQARQVIEMSPRGDKPKTEREARARKAAKSSPKKTAKGGIITNLDAETEEFREKMANWEKFLSISDFEKLLEAIEGIIEDKLILLAETEAA
jgi:hypothetical protein